MGIIQERGAGLQKDRLQARTDLGKAQPLTRPRSTGWSSIKAKGLQRENQVSWAIDRMFCRLVIPINAKH